MGLMFVLESLARRGLVLLDRIFGPAKPKRCSSFCEQCIELTTEESPGDTLIINYLIGTRLIGARNPFH